MAKKKIRQPTLRYKNQSFLSQLGAHCRKLRIQKGYSIDRMSKEGDQLSPAAIHRLEMGSADVHVSLLHRYSQVLNVSVTDLLSFESAGGISNTKLKIIPYADDARPPKSGVPFYPIEVVAGRFASSSEEVLEPKAWVVLENQKTSKDHFVAQVMGTSMEPAIPSGSFCLFKRYTGGSRNGQIMLVQARGIVDPETGGRFVLKRYKRITQVGEDESREKVVIHLISENTDFAPIVLKASKEEDISTPAVFVKVLGQNDDS